MAPRTAIDWKDSAAVGAALFLNLFFLEGPGAPLRLNAFPLALVLFACLSAVLVAAAFYLAGRGASGGGDPGLPMETGAGKAAYVCAILTLTAPLCALCVTTLSWAFERWWIAMLDLGQPLHRRSIGMAESLVWIAWATWVASRGRAVVARAARVWAWAGLALLVGGCLGLRREIQTYLWLGNTRFEWVDFADSLSLVLGSTIALSILAGLFTPAARSRLARATFLGVGGGLAAAILLESLLLAGLSQRIHDGDLVKFHVLVGGAASPYGDARLLVAAMTMLPLLRLSASAIVEMLRGLRVPAPGWIAFLALSAYLWQAGTENAWEQWRFGNVMAACVAGVLSGRGLAYLLGLPARRSVRRRSELLGLVAAVVCAALAHVVSWWNISILTYWGFGGWDSELVPIPYLVALVVTAASRVLFGGGRRPECV